MATRAGSWGSWGLAALLLSGCAAGWREGRRDQQARGRAQSAVSARAAAELGGTPAGWTVFVQQGWYPYYLLQASDGQGHHANYVAECRHHPCDLWRTTELTRIDRGEVALARAAALARASADLGEPTGALTVVLADIELVRSPEKGSPPSGPAWSFAVIGTGARPRTARYEVACGEGSPCNVVQGGLLPPEPSWESGGVTWTEWSFPVYTALTSPPGLPAWPPAGETVEVAGSLCTVTEGSGGCRAACGPLEPDQQSTDPEWMSDSGCWKLQRVVPTASEQQAVAAWLSGKSPTPPPAYSGKGFRELLVTTASPACARRLAPLLGLDAETAFHEPVHGGGLRFSGDEARIREGGAWRDDRPGFLQVPVIVTHASGVARQIQSESGARWEEAGVGCFADPGAGRSQWNIQPPDRKGWLDLAGCYATRLGKVDPADVVPSELFDRAAAELAAGHWQESRSLYRRWESARTGHPAAASSHPVALGDTPSESWEGLYADLETGRMRTDRPCGERYSPPLP